MTLDNCQITYSGYRPEPTVIGLIEQKIRRLSTSAPSDSRINLNLVIGESDVTGFLKIRSLSGQFEANRTGRNPSDVVGHLAQQISSQLQSWSRSRAF